MFKGSEPFAVVDHRVQYFDAEGEDYCSGARSERETEKTSKSIAKCEGSKGCWQTAAKRSTAWNLQGWLVTQLREITLFIGCSLSVAEERTQSKKSVDIGLSPKFIAAWSKDDNTKTAIQQVVLCLRDMKIWRDGDN